jgi:hypothetical protein
MTLMRSCLDSVGELFESYYSISIYVEKVEVLLAASGLWVPGMKSRTSRMISNVS